MNNFSQNNDSFIKEIINNNVSRIQEIINSGVNINQQYGDAEGLTPLIQAINLCRVEVLQMLLEAGADVHLSQYPEDTPLGLATSSGNLEIVKLLLQAGANPNIGGITNPPLHRAVLIERVDLVETLIKWGANINHRNASGFTPLMTAANNGKLEIVKLLVNAGAYIKATDSDGETALQKAKFNSHQEVFNYLLQLTTDE